MTQTAVVTRLEGGLAQIEVKRVSACAHDCSKCGGGCGELMKNSPVSVWAKNPLNAQPGDKVVVASDTGSILGTAVLVYLFPLVLFFAGYFLVRAAGASEGIGIGCGALCFAASMPALVWADRRMKRRNRELFSIVEICRE